MNGRIVKLFLAALLALLGPVAHASGTVTYVYTDPQGTPLAEADASGAITATFDYKPYGSQVLGSPKAGPGYTGHVNDPDTGFVYMQARYYDPGVGRFLSIDPVSPMDGRFSRYTYASNDPVDRIDPDGRSDFIFGDCAENPNCYGSGGGDADRAARARAASDAANRALADAGVLGRYYSGERGESNLVLAWAAAINPLRLKVEVGSNIMFDKDRGYTCSPAYSSGDWTTIDPTELGDMMDPSVNGAVAEIHSHPVNSNFSGTTAYALPFKSNAINSGSHGHGDLPRYFQYGVDGFVSDPNGTVYGWRYRSFKNSVDQHGWKFLGEGVYTLKGADE